MAVVELGSDDPPESGASLGGGTKMVCKLLGDYSRETWGNGDVNIVEKKVRKQSG